MKLMRLRSPLYSLFVAVLLVALPFFCSEVQAQRGGGGRGWWWRQRWGPRGRFRAGGGAGPRPRLGGRRLRRGWWGLVAPGGRGRLADLAMAGGVGGPGLRRWRLAALVTGLAGVPACGHGVGALVWCRRSFRGGGTHNRNVNVTRTGTPTWPWLDRRLAAGAAAGLAVGATVAYLSAAAQPVAVNNQTYYVDGNTYYQKCYQGSQVAYCVVPSPNKRDTQAPP
jgi:hypothetical protein